MHIAREACMKFATYFALCILLLWRGLVLSDYQVSGNITDYLLKGPAESCLVMLTGLSPNTKTDSIRTEESGSYLFDSVPAGAYELRIADNRYVPDSVRAIIDRDTVFSFIVFASAHVLGANNIPDTLKKNGSPYVVRKLVEITKPLTIEAGAKITFLKESSIFCRADLVAEGKNNDSIRFIGDYFIPNKDSMALQGGQIRIYSWGRSIFKYCRFENFRIYTAMNQLSYMGFERCLFIGMAPALQCLTTHPVRLCFKNNRVINCMSGVIGDLSVHGILADSLEMVDNVLLCSREALSLGLGSQRKAYIRRNTIFGATTIDLSHGVAYDTIASNIFSAVNFANIGGRNIFFAYNDFPFSSDSMPMGVGKASLINVKGDSCDFYYNISKDPLIADSMSGANEWVSLKYRYDPALSCLLTRVAIFLPARSYILTVTRSERGTVNSMARIEPVRLRRSIQ